MITYEGQKASRIFTYNEHYKMMSLVTNNLSKPLKEKWIISLNQL